ncbi:hypothetical protein V6N13_076770 [Hibiscus sabdariffa]|uniref:Uncharacterized protein n=1 Tax=Hibiscus sabdariffa TaxID=183260 RepID=A0ABR1ZES3_9ROSI
MSEPSLRVPSETPEDSDRPNLSRTFNYSVSVKRNPIHIQFMDSEAPHPGGLCGVCCSVPSICDMYFVY